MRIIRSFRKILGTVFIAAFAVSTFAQHGDLSAELSAKQLQPAEGLKVELFASDPLFFNPVAFSIDEKGRFFISETHRYKDSIFDLWRMKDKWALADFSWRTVEDREKFLAKEFATNISVLTKDSEIIRLVEDKDGDGRADSSSVFADRFNKTTAGTAAGVLARKGDVWFTCIPDLWKIKHSADGKKLSQEVLSTGYGVHISVSGHDLHGLVMGPDGRIYFSVGDRGANVKTKEGKQLDLGQTGGVFRCNPDGSELEIFAIGLRNPQELAFDEFGNLWTHDNDTAGEDKSRVIHIVEGGDYGWRQSYQFMEGFGPWVQDKIWQGNIDDVLPPAGYGAKGPSGLAFYPGVGLPEKYNGALLGCDFPQGVWAYFKKTKGASYELEKEKFLWGFGATDVEFGPDCNVYVSDWGKSYNMPNAGKIYRVSVGSSRGNEAHPSENNNQSLLTSAATDVKKLLSEELAKPTGIEAGESTSQITAKNLRSVNLPRLQTLLGHADARVRQNAQFALADKEIEIQVKGLRKGDNSFVEVLKTSTNQLARIHAIWGLENMSRIFEKAPRTSQDQNKATNGNTLLKPLLSFCSDPDPEIRAQVARTFGECRFIESNAQLTGMLKDSNSRVRFFAAVSLGKLKDKTAIPMLAEMLEANADQDSFLTHAGVCALVNIGDFDAIQAAAKSESAPVRRAVMLAMRRMKRPEIAQFLHDENERISIEVAHAINDVPIPEALPDLAGKLDDCKCGFLMDLRRRFISRAINANLYFGKPENYARVANFLLHPKAPEDMRIAALNALADWENPSPLDHVVGLWRPLTNRTAKLDRQGFFPVLEVFMNSSVEKIALAAIHCADNLKITNASPALFSIFRKAHAPATVRIRALQTLGSLNAPQMGEAVELALNNTNNSIRAEGITRSAQMNPKEAAPLLQKILANETDIRLHQNALVALGDLKDSSADEILSRELDKLLSGKIKAELQLEVLEASGKRNAPAIQEKLKQYEANFSQSDPLAPWRVSLAGGDAERGKTIFQENDAVGCLRCHAVKGKGGIVGPDLAGIASRQAREYLLESIIFPNAQIAVGFEAVTILMKNGASYAGIVTSETEEQLILNSPEEGVLTLKKSEIAKRNPSLSAMPEGITALLTKRDIRDIVEYMVNLK